jgi:hypothetical protein
MIKLKHLKHQTKLIKKLLVGKKSGVEVSATVLGSSVSITHIQAGTVQQTV